MGFGLLINGEVGPRLTTVPICMEQQETITLMQDIIIFCLYPALERGFDYVRWIYLQDC
jgi:hypothetical protein